MKQKNKKSTLATICNGRLGLYSKKDEAGRHDGLFAGTVRDYSIPGNLDAMTVSFGDQQALIQFVMNPCPHPLVPSALDAGKDGVHLFGEGVLVKFPKREGQKIQKFSLLSEAQFASESQGTFVPSATLHVDGEHLSLVID